jgi:hypothetical protein
MPLDMKNLIVNRLKRDSIGLVLVDHTPTSFKSFDAKNERYATLSWGLFDEEHAPKDVEQYGRALLDTKTKRIIELVEHDVLYNGYPLDVGVFGWAIDPLTWKYPAHSPYTAFADNPIMFIDTDGREWINYYDAIVNKMEKSLLENPNNKKIQRQLGRMKKEQAKVNEIINNLKESDEALYNYIENLTVTDAITNEEVNVKVTVRLGSSGGKEKGENASTKYRNGDSKGNRRYVQYNGLEGLYSTVYAPIDKNDEIGFDVTLFSPFNFSDISLSNEAGDVMFRMEYPEACHNSGSDAYKDYDQYLEKGTAGYYSYKVEDLYKERKTEKAETGKNAIENPYPIKNE